MCGIVGIFNYISEAPVIDRDELLSIRDHMSTRGPDDAGLWLSNNGCVGLGHRRLSIIDLSEAASQPMSDPDTGNRIVFNGEIYNYQRLRDELELKGHQFQTQSDTEVLLKLYSVHGQDMVHKLRGMYAFAIWDEREQGIFLARDPFGIKPLYVIDDGKSMRFASQVKALIAGGAVDTAPEPAGHVGFFLWGYIPEPYTLYRGIRALPAGHSLWIGVNGCPKTTKFFDLSEELSSASQPISEADGEPNGGLREGLLDSMKHHLIADVPVGIFLSAGLDSSTLTSLATEVGGGKLTTVTLGFEGFAQTENDETGMAETLAKQYGTIHHTVWVKKSDFTDRYNQLLDSMDQPSIDGVNSFFVCSAAKQAGLKAVISGLGGDELFGGYSSFRDIPRLVSLVKPLGWIPFLGRGFRYVSASVLKRFTSPKYAGLLEYGGDYSGAYLLRYALYMPWELPEVLDAELVKEGWQTLRTMEMLQDTCDGLECPFLKIKALEHIWYMRSQLLRDADWASMAHSLELRVPLVDVELFRVVNRLFHLGESVNKTDMANCPKIKLPECIIRRRKTGFSIPVQAWIRKENRYRENMSRGLRGWAREVYEHQTR